MRILDRLDFLLSYRNQKYARQRSITERCRFSFLIFRMACLGVYKKYVI